MQSVLVNRIISKDKMFDIKYYTTLKNVKEYILYSDNVLEGITLLNDLTLDANYLDFMGVIYEPVDQPIYLFKDENGQVYSIKICGAYNNWNLPKQVSEIISYIDLPDYVFYSINSQKVILAGENTETASVGNSQWQREGRKLGSARLGVPFVYQTFYSGRDESQDSIREPNSLQVYNHLVYSVRYRTPSFVVYFENNFENSSTRVRNDNAKELLSKYIKSVIISDSNPSFLSIRRENEKNIYLHMLAYLRESKFNNISNNQLTSRLYLDLPILKKEIADEILNNSENFVDALIEYLYNVNTETFNGFQENLNLVNFDENKFLTWKCYDRKNFISDLISFLKNNNSSVQTYIKKSAKVGLVDTEYVNQFLKTKFVDSILEIDAVLDKNKFSQTLLIPLRIFKNSNGSLTFSPDPESGEVVAFSELFGFDILGKKKRVVVGYGIVQTPNNFDIRSKENTKLYKALSRYVDVLIINNSVLITNLPNTNQISNFVPNNILTLKPLHKTEEMAVVSTYLNQSTIESDWEMCFIHTHHSSWQQLVIRNNKGIVRQMKIDRVSTKVDLIMQKLNCFMICEGKNDYKEIINDKKIQKAITDSSNIINNLYGDKNTQFDVFVYNLNVDVTKNPEYYLNHDINMIEGAIKLGHFNNIAYHENYIILIVYIDSNNKTKFKLVYSPNFNNELKVVLDKEFCQ